MIKIKKLMCEHQKTPAVIASRSPFFSWSLESDKPNVYQKAYHIRVWLEEKNTQKLLWDSGMVDSSQTVEVLYEGMELKRGSEYQYAVEVFTNNGEHTVSETGVFWTALEWNRTDTDSVGSGNEWKARWIEPSVPLPQLKENPLNGARRIWGEILQKMMRGEQTEILLDDQMMAMQEIEPYDPAFLVKKDFILGKTIKRARVYVTAHGIYTIRLNEQEVTDTRLNPGFTSYDKRIKYQIFDVAPILLKGKNVITAEIADGWYKGKIALGHGCEYGEIPGFLMQMKVEYEDGTEEWFCTDETWQYTFDGPVREADLFQGEIYDARRCQKTEEIEWKKVCTAVYDDQILEAQCHPGVKVFEELPAKEIITTPKGETVIDFRQNLAGVLRVELNGMAAGEQVVFEHGEVLDEEGNFYYVFTGDATRQQRDIFISTGEEKECFEPVYTYHGFRYVKVTGGHGWNVSQFTALAISSDNTVTGNFRCSDERINQLQNNIYWSQRSNNVTIPTDCPTREKAGWTGDVLVYGKTALYNQDMTAFYRDWLKSMRAEQLPDGKVQNTVPLIKNYVQQAGGGSIGWGDVILTLPWELYTLSGNTNVLKENYEAMGKWMECIRGMAAELPQNAAELTGKTLENQSYLVNTGFHFGDWLVPSIKNAEGFADGPASSFMTMNTVCTALLAHSADLYAEISEVLGETDTAREYHQYAEHVRKAFEEELCDDNGRLNQELQGNYILALQMRMVPDEKRKWMAARLNQLLEEAAYRLDTGFMSVPYILDVLYDYGYEKTAWEVLMQENCPGWMYEIQHGATTMWESWSAIREDGKVGHDSFNHYAFGCVGDFLYRRILGINHTGTGYDKIRLTPNYECRLEYAEGSYDSVHGKIELYWEKKDGTVKISGKVPANTNAVLVLRNGEEKELGNGMFELYV